MAGSKITGSLDARRSPQGRLEIAGQTGDQEPAEIDVGRRLHELRGEQKLSLRALAEKSGLNFNTLSLIENGKSSPSVNTLQQLALALQVPISAFFESEPSQKSLVFQKSGLRPRAVFEQGIFEDLGAGLTMRGGQPLLVSLDISSESGPNPIVHTGHEFVFCLEGRLTYLVEDETFNLEPGDSLIFEAHLPHRWWNQGEIPSLSLLILCPTDENDQPSKRHFPVR
jgi:transcriptional regulator with XRE-family HTH domain